MKVVIGTVLAEQAAALVAKLEIPDAANVKKFTWEGSPVPQDQAEWLVMNADEDASLLDTKGMEGADVIIVGCSFGHRVIRDNRPGRGPKEFEFDSKNYFGIYPDMDSALTEAEKAVGVESVREGKARTNTRIERVCIADGREVVVVGYVKDEETHLHAKPSRIRVVVDESLKDCAELALIKEHATEAGLRAFTIDGVPSLLLMQLNAHYDEAGAVRDIQGTQWAGLDSVRDMLLYAYLELRQDITAPWDVVFFLKKVMHAYEGWLCADESIARMDGVFTDFGPGAVFYAVQDLQDKGMLTPGTSPKLTQVGLVVYHLLCHIVDEQETPVQ